MASLQLLWSSCIIDDKYVIDVIDGFKNWLCAVWNGEFSLSYLDCLNSEGFLYTIAGVHRWNFGRAKKKRKWIKTVMTWRIQLSLRTIFFNGIPVLGPVALVPPFGRSNVNKHWKIKCQIPPLALLDILMIFYLKKFTCSNTSGSKYLVRSGPKLESPSSILTPGD